MTRIAQLFTQLFPALPSQAAKEHAYLAGSVSLYDLECRERDVARGLFAQGSYRSF